MRRGKPENKRGRKRAFAVLLAFAATLITGFILITLLQPQTQEYAGRYGSAVKALIDRFSRDWRWSNATVYYPVLRHIYYEYYLKLYNTSTLVNQPFTIVRGKPAVYRIFLGANETVRIETWGNGTYTYSLVVELGGALAKLYEEPGNTSREVGIADEINLVVAGVKRKVILYGPAYINLSTNSTIPVSGYIRVSKDPPRNLSSILRVFPVEYTTWLFQNWIKERFKITPVDFSKLGDTRPPWEILFSDNTTEISSLEACLILNRLYNATGIETRIIAVDLDGDGEADTFALALKYGKTPDQFAGALLNYILEDANLSFGENRINLKYFVLDNTVWIVLDPLYEDERVPGHIKLEYYSFLGFVT